MSRFLLAAIVLLLAIWQPLRADEPAKLADLKLNWDKLKSWQEKEYSFRASAGDNPADSLGKFIFRTKVTADEIVLHDTLKAVYRGKVISLHVTQHCLKQSSLSPTEIKTEVERGDDLASLNIKFEGTSVTVTGADIDRKMEIERPLVTAFAFARIVTLLPKKKGLRVKFPRWLEPEEMNLKQDFEVECLGEDKATWQGEDVAATKYSLSGKGIAKAYYWVSEDGILRQILIDGRKTIQFEFNVPPE
jgi:hypothetical protein